MKRKYWTVVLRGTKQTILPVDNNPGGDDGGMLVYRDKESAEAAADYQFDMYSIECGVCPLGKEDRK